MEVKVKKLPGDVRPETTETTALKPQISQMINALFRAETGQSRQNGIKRSSRTSFSHFHHLIKSLTHVGAD